MNGKIFLKNVVLSLFILTIILNTTMTYLLTIWIREDRKALRSFQSDIQHFQKDIQELKKQIEVEIKLRQELFPKLQKSAQLLSKYNTNLDYVTALKYAYWIYECSDTEVSMEILSSLIVVESSANHKAISNKGALGLTQVMPTIWGYKKDTLFNPYKNIEIGSRILKYYVGLHGLIGGLSAYNSGRKDISQSYARYILQIADRHF